MKNRQMIKHLGVGMPFFRDSYKKAVLLKSEAAAQGIPMFFRKRRKQHTTDASLVLRNFLEVFKDSSHTLICKTSLFSAAQQNKKCYFSSSL